MVLENTLLEEAGFHPPDKLLGRALLLRLIRPAQLGHHAQFDACLRKGRIPARDLAVVLPGARDRARAIENAPQRYATKTRKVLTLRADERLGALVLDEALTSRHAPQPPSQHVTSRRTESRLEYAPRYARGEPEPDGSAIGKLQVLLVESSKSAIKAQVHGRRKLQFQCGLDVVRREAQGPASSNKSLEGPRSRVLVVKVIAG